MKLALAIITLALAGCQTAGPNWALIDLLTKDPVMEKPTDPPK